MTAGGAHDAHPVAGTAEKPHFHDRGQTMADPTQQEEPTQQTGPTAESVRADVAELLGRDADGIGADENLLDAGLDSIRIMSLIERWRAAGADAVEFPDLAERPELGHWISLLTKENA